jgi:hypothetical protein
VTGNGNEPISGKQKTNENKTKLNTFINLNSFPYQKSAFKRGTLFVENGGISTYYFKQWPT